jgi:hypothetical protein
MAPVRLDEGEQHGSELYGLRLGPDFNGTTLFGCSILRHETGT